jgi:hypothetical protein
MNSDRVSGRGTESTSATTLAGLRPQRSRVCCSLRSVGWDSGIGGRGALAKLQDIRPARAHPPRAHCIAVVSSITRAAFEAYIEQSLSAALEPGQVVVMDNLSAH